MPEDSWQGPHSSLVWLLGSRSGGVAGARGPQAVLSSLGPPASSSPRRAAHRHPIKATWRPKETGVHCGKSSPSSHVAQARAGHWGSGWNPSTAAFCFVA